MELDIETKEHIHSARCLPVPIKLVHAIPLCRLLMSLLLIAISGSTYAITRHVSYIPAKGQDTGLCIFNSCRTIEYAVSVAQAGDVIHVSSAPIIKAIENPISIDKSLSIIGFDVTATPNTGARVKIGGNGNGRLFWIYPGRFVRLANVELSGGIDTDGGAISNQGRLIMQNCGLHDNVASDRGGAIFNQGEMTINTSDIESNEAVEGGGIYNSRTLSLVRGTRISNNRAVSNGGGLFVSESSGVVSIRQTRFTENGIDEDGTATTAYGGAIFLEGAESFSISESTFTTNKSSLHGGALAIFGGIAEIDTSLFRENESGSGGAIFNSSEGSYMIMNSTFNTNRASNGGAVADETNLDVPLSRIIQKSSFVYNTASNDAGAVFYGPANGTLAVENSTFSQNEATDGGGAILNESNNGEIRITNATFFGNVADQGAAFYNDGLLALKNSIVERSKNFLGNYTDACAGLQLLAGNRNMVGTDGKIDGSCGGFPNFTFGAVIGLDINAVNNGDTCVGVPEDCVDPELESFLFTHTLEPGSTAIDQGADNCPDAAGIPLATDQIDVPRPLGGACDVGAIEAN